MKRRNGRWHTAQSGLAVIEFAMVLPLMLVLMFGLIDFGRMILTRQVLINVSREAANLTSRGTTMDDAITAVKTSAQPLDIPAHGYVILTEIVRDTNGNATIAAQRASGGAPRPSKIGTGVGSGASLPTTEHMVPPAGRSLFVAEVYYESPPITPVGELAGITMSELFYDVAFF